MTSARSCLTICLVLTLCATPLTAPATTAPVVTAVPADTMAQPTPDLSGVWTLADSDVLVVASFVERAGELLPTRGRDGRGSGGHGTRGGGPGGMGGGPGGRGGFGGGMGGRPGRGAPPPAGPGATAERGHASDVPLEELEKASRQLLISHHEGSVEIMDGTDRTTVWVPGERPRPSRGPGGAEVTRRAEWVEDSLVIELDGSMLTIRRTLRLVDDGAVLAVELTLENVRGQRRTVRLRYLAAG